MRDDNGLDPFLTRQLLAEAAERLSRRRREREQALADGIYGERYGKLRRRTTTLAAREPKGTIMNRHQQMCDEIGKRLWPTIHQAIAAMPVQEFVERLQAVHSDPQATAPRFFLNDRTGVIEVHWGGAPLATLHWEALAPDADVTGEWTEPAPDDPSGLTG